MGGNRNASICKKTKYHLQALFFCFISLFPSYVLDLDYTAKFHQPLCLVLEKMLLENLWVSDNNFIGSVETYPYCRVIDFRCRDIVFGIYN